MAAPRQMGQLHLIETYLNTFFDVMFRFFNFFSNLLFKIVSSESPKSTKGFWKLVEEVFLKKFWRKNLENQKVWFVKLDAADIVRVVQCDQ